MADDATATDGGAKTFSQSELDAIVRDRLKREREKYADYDELKARATDADRNKGALEKLLDRFGALETKLKESALRDLRAEVAEKKGLTRNQAKRLVGETIDELMADADDLIASFRPASGEDGGKDGKDDAASNGDGKDGDAGKGDAGKTGDTGKTPQGGKDGVGKDSAGKDGDEGKKSLPASGRPTEKLTSGAVPAASGDKSPAQIAEEILSRPF